MSEKQPNELMSFSSFADWCRHIDSLSQEARHTVKVLLEKAGTDDAEAAEQILSSMTKLDINSNRITDISSLGSLTNLTTLDLSNNQITDISFLGSLTNLTTLSLYFNGITDISFLGSLTNLTTLELSINQITDISFLGSLTNLTTLNLNWNQITDIRFLGSLTNLTTLQLGANLITDFSFLGSLTNLTTLYLYFNEVTDISFLGSLTNLTRLELSRNQITDISSLSSFTNLTTLNLCENLITDISALRELTHLTTLNLDDNNRITNISVLGELAQKRLTLSTKPIDAEKATAAIKVAYATIGLKEPEIIICSSPGDAFLQIFNLPKRDRSQNYSNEWRWNRSGQKLNWKWMSPSIVREFANPLVWQHELYRIRIESEADSRLSSLMNDLVEEYKRSEPTIGNVFTDHLLSLISPQTPTTLFKEIYLTELYISSLGVNLSEKAQEILRCQKLLFEHCGWIFPFEKFCAVCDRPRHLRFDSQNRLHAEGEPAIEFADGWNFYYYHGVRLPEEYGKFHPNQWQSQWILAEDNAELRRVLIEGIGYARIIQELSAKQIDSWQEYALLQIDEADDIDDGYDVEPICLLKMTCPSTGFIHALRVPPYLISAREAIRWVNWDIDPEEFSVQT
ncbi:leucine-rich repeat domain-containing protein [Microcoleus sp. T3B2]|uniref:leucine-rich repeat domain-containing protein n=1 Tax=Microcoleus sp. T3B2 TaxID=3055426 RepID=UPI002FCFEDBA